MTATQKDRTLGFKENLKKRQFILTLEGSAISFPALVPPLTAQNDQFQLGENEREFSRINVLRENLPVPNPIGVGNYLLDASTSRRHRVAEILDHPTDIAVVMVCETVPLSP